MKNVLLLKAGEAAPAIRQSVGDYDRWFEVALARSSVPTQLQVLLPYLGEKLPDAREYDAIVMTGSPQSVTRPSDWMKHAAEYLRAAIEDKIPVLGVCFGHQLLAYAYGSSVVLNPHGREIGTIEVDLTPEGKLDPLFQGIPSPFRVHATHEDIVDVAPSRARVLARNTLTEVQAMVIAEYGRGVQFHPELSAEGISAVIQSRVDTLEREWKERGEGGDRVPSLLAGVGAAPHGVQILSNFLRHFARG